jgi:glutathione S-transferase
MLAQYARLNDVLVQHSPRGPFLFEDFGYAEAVFTPMFMRFWFLDYYEDFSLPEEPAYARVAAWREACLAHPAAQQVTRERIVKLYYDYAKGAGNGALLPGRARSSFVFEPDWPARPWPPRDKYGHAASDAELGLA